MQLRHTLCSLLLAVLAAGASAAPSTGSEWTLAVSEGTSGGIDSADILAKYDPLAQLIQRATGRKVRVVLAREFDRLEASMKAGAYDFVMARPSDYPARGIRDYGYQMVATMKPDGQCYIVVKKDSPLKTVKDLKGATLLLPEKAAYMSKLCSAELRDQGINLSQEPVKFLREQEAVAWSVRHDLAGAGGLASYSKAGKEWEKEGGRILHKSVTQPYFPLIAGKDVPAADVEKIREALRQAEQTEEGAKIMARIGIKGFNIEDEKRLLKLLDWLKL